MRRWILGGFALTAISLGLVYEFSGPYQKNYQWAAASVWFYPVRPKSKQDPSLVISKDAVLYCMDPRFAPLAEAWMRETFPHEAFHISHAGGWRAVLDPVSRPGVLLEIETFVRLGGKTLHGMCHLECAAYSDMPVPDNAEEATVFYAAEGKEAARIIQLHFPSLAVNVYVMTFEGIELVEAHLPADLASAGSR